MLTAFGLLYVAIMLLTALALHGVFALWSFHNGHPYPRLHVLRRASAGAGLGFRLLNAVLMLGALVWIALRVNRRVCWWLRSLSKPGRPNEARAKTVASAPA